MDWRYFACSRETYITQADITPKDVSIVVQRRPQDSEPTLIITWTGSSAFQRSSDQHRIVYHLKILRDRRTVWMSTMNQNGTSMAIEVLKVAATYKAVITLEANGLILSSTASNSVFFNADGGRRRSLIVLLASTLFFLLCALFLCLIMQAILLKTESNNYKKAITWI
ncbi:uncharacterized protein LOC142338299 [Convolutriloba macropyga]|uniref:uncharacterized protein LOC142338299 n=1 Tax=Convolutriloba macropyga TaxID=536237 RepID=UPI003F520EDF